MSTIIIIKKIIKACVPNCYNTTLSIWKIMKYECLTLTPSHIGKQIVYCPTLFQLQASISQPWNDDNSRVSLKRKARTKIMQVSDFILQNSSNDPYILCGTVLTTYLRWIIITISWRIDIFHSVPLQQKKKIK